MEAFATIEDLEMLYEVFGRDYDLEDKTAQVLLDMASASVSEAFASARKVIDSSDEAQALKLKNVVCSMVMRFTAQKSIPDASSIAQSIGSTSVSVSYREPSYSFTLLPSELKDLGLMGRHRYRSIRAAIHKQDGTLVEGW